MQFENSMTRLNLARSFAGESQAAMRYRMIARAAAKQGQSQLCYVLNTIAQNEDEHARRFFEELTKHGGNDIDNIELEAGYPFHTGDLATAMRLAAKDEREEHQRIYQSFANEAQSEGLDDIAALFKMVANVEKRHEQVFEYLAEAFEKGKLYKNDAPILYICSKCGYMHTANEAWKTCPLCRSDQSEVILHIPYDKEKL